MVQSRLDGWARMQAACVYLIQRADCTAFAPCHAADPAYGQAVIQAQKRGVLLLPLLCSLDAVDGAISFEKAVPLVVDHALAQNDG